MDAKKHLTSFEETDESEPDVASLLNDAGLELWQAPEGFWTIRLKQPAPQSPSRLGRNRPTEGVWRALR